MCKSWASKAAVRELDVAQLREGEDSAPSSNIILPGKCWTCTIRTPLSSFMLNNWMSLCIRGLIRWYNKKINFIGCIFSTIKKGNCVIIHFRDLSARICSRLIISMPVTFTSQDRYVHVCSLINIMSINMMSWSSSSDVFSHVIATNLTSFSSIGNSVSTHFPSTVYNTRSMLVLPLDSIQCSTCLWIGQAHLGIIYLGCFSAQSPRDLLIRTKSGVNPRSQPWITNRTGSYQWPFLPVQRPYSVHMAVFSAMGQSA